MTLQQFIQVITGNANIVMTVKDSNETMLIKFYVGGQAVLSAALLSRTIAAIKFENATSIIIDLDAAPNGSVVHTGG